MSKLMTKIRCRMGRHQWHPIRVQGQDGRECGVCHERNFDPSKDLAYDDIDVNKGTMGGLGSGGGGGF